MLDPHVDCIDFSDMSLYTCYIHMSSDYIDYYSHALIRGYYVFTFQYPDAIYMCHLITQSLLLK
jgi:hypothetical protein